MTMNYKRSIILTIPLLISAHICWAMKKEITDSQQFDEQIGEIKELKEHRKKAKLFAIIGCFLPCFCPAAYYHYRKARK